MRLKSLFWLLLLPAGMTGCASNEPAGGGPNANGPPGPTSALDTGAPADAAPPAVSGVDLAVAKLIRRTLKEDQALAAAAKDVKVAIDKGVVTLRGRVSSDSEREAVISRISKLPGVDRVDDRLQIGEQ